MFEVTVNTRRAVVGSKEPITTSSAGIQVQFTFSEDWDGLSRFAIFRNGEDMNKIPVALPNSNLVTIPAQSCAEEYIDEPLFVGVYGSDGVGTVIIPTVWASLGVLREGAVTTDIIMPAEPTPDMWAQILAIANEAAAIADECEENEELRITAEQLRANAETARANAEILRAQAEVERSGNETQRQSAETQRQTAEGARAQAEALRVQAEELRQANETSRVSAESDRASAEQTRQSQETTRASNETARVTAEQGRASAESGRVTAETNRVSAETVRTSAESARATAEQNRASAETARASAESARATAESTRASNEQSRVSAESARAQAETDRATEFATWESTIASKVPNTRTVNGKALSADITLDSGDIGYDATETYQSGTIGEAVSDLTRQLSDLKENQIPGLQNDIVNSGLYDSEEKILSAYTRIEYGINTSNVWKRSTTSSPVSSFFIPADGQPLSITVTSNATNGSVIAFMKNNSHSANTSAVYATGTGRTFIPAGETKQYNIPSDCNYIYILESWSDDYLPQSIVFTYYTLERAYSEKTKKIKVKMRHARIGSAGNESGAIVDTWMMYNYALSVKLIKIYNGSAIITIDSTIPSGLSVQLVCYDKNYDFLGFYNIGEAPYSTYYVKLYVFKPGQSSTVTTPIEVPEVDITVTYHGEEPILVYNMPQSDAVYPLTKWISYEMREPQMPINSDGITLGGSQNLVWNNGYVILPPNYTSEGSPVKLIIFVHGSDGYRFNESEIRNYGTLLNFLANNGYAVCDCSTMTNLHASVYDANYPSPLSYACYTELYRYLIDAYNIDDSGCYIFGKSAGGQNTIQMSLMRNLPIKAAGVIAGSVDSIINAKVYIGSTEWAAIILWLQSLGIDTSGITSSDYIKDNNPLWTDIVENNFEKFIGFNPMWFASANFDKRTFAETVASISCSEANLSSNQTIQDIISDAERIQCAPIKLWHAEDDANVPISIARMFQKTVRNGGGICAMHTFPSGYGAHWMGDTAEEAPKVDFDTKYGGTINTTVVYAELIQWFNQW